MDQRILLADNSYTIRRIVELSFQDIENVELFSFESGANLKEKLLEIRPQVVLIDIKLPEFNGYEACKFINEEPSLVNTKILLMKGGFEPIDEDLLTNLKYEDIITKPFDSKLLESQVTKLLKEAQTMAPPPPMSMPEELEMPSFSEKIDESEISIDAPGSDSSFPDSFPDFSDEPKGGGDDSGISFSDVNDAIAGNAGQPSFQADQKATEAPPANVPATGMDYQEAVKEIDTPGILSDDDFGSSMGNLDDEVEPSEEITQGAFEEHPDTLADDSEDDILNPFKDDAEIKIGAPKTDVDEEAALKEQIKQHEDHLGMESLTVEEMRIQSQIDSQHKGIDQEEEEYGTDKFGGLDKKPDFGNITFDDEPVLSSEAAAPEQPMPENKIDPSIFQAAEGILNDDIDSFKEPAPASEPEPSMEEPVSPDPFSEGSFPDDAGEEAFIAGGADEPTIASDAIEDEGFQMPPVDAEPKIAEEPSISFPEESDRNGNINDYLGSEEPAENVYDISMGSEAEKPAPEVEAPVFAAPEMPEQQNMNNEGIFSDSPGISESLGATAPSEAVDRETMDMVEDPIFAAPEPEPESAPDPVSVPEPESDFIAAPAMDVDNQIDLGSIDSEQAEAPADEDLLISEPQDSAPKDSDFTGEAGVSAESVISQQFPDETPTHEQIISEPTIQEPVSEPESVQADPVIPDPPVQKPAVSEPSIVAQPSVSTPPTAPRTQAQASSEGIPDSVDMGQVMERVEDKLSVGIKEILWEVIPPLAEKIIKKEIDALKAEIDEKDK